MLLTTFISKSRIAESLKATTKAEALKELTDLLLQAGSLSEVGPVLEQIMIREDTESADIGGGLAIPHTRVAGLGTLVCALGRSRVGLEFRPALGNSPNPADSTLVVCGSRVRENTAARDRR